MVSKIISNKSKINALPISNLKGIHSEGLILLENKLFKYIENTNQTQLGVNGNLKILKGKEIASE